WGLILLLAVLLVRLLVSVFDGMAVPPAATPQKPIKEGAPPEPRARRAQESDVDRLLARAETEREQGRFEAAIATLHAALVHKLGQDELITVEAARTNGDYLHDLARQPKLQGSVRQVFRAVERTQFGRSQPSDELCRDLLGRISSIVKRGAALLLLVAVLPSATSACGSPGHGSPEISPDGLYVMTELLKQNGTQVRRRTRATAKFEEDVERVLVLGEDVPPEVWSGVLAWARGGGSVFAVHPRAELYRELGATVESTIPCSHPLVLGPPHDREQLEVVDVGRRGLHFGQGVPANANVNARCDDEPRIVTIRYGSGTVTLLENPELLSNASLSVGDNAAFVVSLLGAPGFTLELVDEWTGGGETSPVRALQNAGMRPLLLEVLVFMAVFIWRYGSAFGTRRDPNAPARRAFVDHVWALGRSYSRARANRHALGLYSAFALEQLRARFGRGAPLGLIDLAHVLAGRTGQSEQDIMRLLTEAHDAAQDRELERGGATDLDTLHKLERLLYPSGGSP
ncbi:MAG TPA: DUF4350 domain-containing protein, partial [Polyangiaceae bacterium]|nr:DUF4350 domain-containing protein [Polyangiaceae bacterium]